MTKPNVVEQSDRDRAADFLISRESEYQARNGLLDSNPLVQAFAAHRLAEQERCARIAESGVAAERNYSDGNILAYNHARREIAAAIRSGSSPEPNRGGDRSDDNPSFTAENWDITPPSLTDEREAIASALFEHDTPDCPWDDWVSYCEKHKTFRGILENYRSRADAVVACLALRPTETEVAVPLEAIERAIWTAPLLGQPQGYEVRAWPPTDPETRQGLRNQARVVLALLPGTQGEGRHG